MSKLHLMLDLETFGTGSDAAIVSIGAVVFDPTDPQDAIFGTRDALVALDRAFHTGVKHNGRVDLDTVRWWLGQPAEAQHALLQLPRATMEVAARLFSEFASYHKAKALWSNGPTFDEVILRNAYQSVGATFPIHHRESRCFRTIKALVAVTGRSAAIPTGLPDAGFKHDALADAINQARAVNLMYQALKG